MISLSFITTILSVAFVFFIFSVMASMIYEYLSKITKKRSTFLAQSLSKILKDEFVNNVDFSLMFYDHPLITSLKQDEDTYPSYIPARAFAVALIEVVVENNVIYTFNNQATGTTPVTVEKNHTGNDNPDSDAYQKYLTAVDNLGSSAVKTLLGSFAVNAKNYSGLQKNIEMWYDEYMERGTGWYKKTTARYMMYISLALTLFFNVDAIHIMKSLQENSALNNRIAMAAQQYTLANKNTSYDSVSQAQVKELMVLTDSLGIPIGYDFYNSKADPDHQDRVQSVLCSLQEQMEHDGGFLLMIFGWLISAVAISKGAPFWFDVLTKFVNLRSTGTKPQSSKSKDDQS